MTHSRYKWRDNFPSDVIAGLTVAIMHIPQVTRGLMCFTVYHCLHNSGHGLRDPGGGGASDGDIHGDVASPGVRHAGEHGACQHGHLRHHQHHGQSGLCHLNIIISLLT